MIYKLQKEGLSRYSLGLRPVPGYTRESQMGHNPCGDKGLLVPRGIDPGGLTLFIIIFIIYNNFLIKLYPFNLTYPLILQT